MAEAPRFGQRAPQERRESCSKHPGVPATSYCKRCNRPACADCSIRTEVGSICVDCAPAGARKYGKSPWSGKTRQPGSSGGLQVLKSSPVTATLIALNVAVFVAQLFSSAVLNTLAFNPIWAFLQPWRFVSSAFVHAGFWHLLFNMLMLYLLGSAVERALHWWRYLALYLLSAFAGSMLIVGWAFVSPESLSGWTVGASGAIYGMFGAILVLQKRAGMSTTSILTLLGINLVYGFLMPNISWQGHIGGFIGGLLTALLLVAIADKVRRKGRTQTTIWSLVGLAVLTAAMVGGTWGMYALLL